MSKSLVAVLAAVAVSVGLVLVGGCESDAQTGAAVGAAAGAGIGQLAGRDTESTLIGAAVGGGAGYMIGNEQDKKKTAAERDSIRQEMNTVTVWITNSNGSKIPVKLTKQGAGYVGPRGEYYETLPTQEQLKPVYGF
ncbi:MAG TPA: glycine zipper domain-containing protein [Sedimentisphaerales bacterium]|nr:glycine zipper domain-containing protein [Sedimentisphaerales bacterium]